MAFGRRNRPSLLETAARTAVISGTASAVTGRAARKQAAAAAAAAPAAPPVAPTEDATPAATGGDDVIAKIERLAALHSSGALTDDEFAALKKQAIGS